MKSLMLFIGQKRDGLNGLEMQLVALCIWCINQSIVVLNEKDAVAETSV